ncbi:hypothetical protein DYBT9275_03849 [Dyadobacter sp. CECT 9275]|uniref:Novel STAND NTPase 3 domain-containing protein n=1 Tax=Dyadobacter helix TaxID=2822344 RepID=A0A916JIC4_9BACT|nr:hypothetical protein [Dyadobacter sp. CECT 9275]CAG5006558.1 hypothetical protein DYBT9275_03849 [Dyadobacter sp. CECT 9275]
MSKVNANQVSYELHSLGWKAFQDLCASIVGEIWGQTIESYFDSNDGGRDGAFHGIWQESEISRYDGTFTVQCKFTGMVDKPLKLADLEDETLKAARLASQGLADNYFIFTNARLTGKSAESIFEKFQNIPGIKRFQIFGRERICRIIHESRRLRMLVPRIYGLGDLSQILDERAYTQAIEILSSLGNDLNKFIITDAYKKSAEALTKHGFVLLLGEPMCGKSTIAAALAMGALDIWGCSTIKVRDATDFVKHSNPYEKQLFWIDDAFGATQFDWNSAASWNKSFPHMTAALTRGSKVIFTSRSYVYETAKRFLKESALPIIKESQVVIRVENLTKDEREQILYNHIRLGNQSTTYKQKIKPLLKDVAAHKNFSPEIARRLGNKLFTQNLRIEKWDIERFVAKPLALLREIIETLDDGSRSALALVFIRGGQLLCPVQLDEREREAIERIGGIIADARKGLEALNGSLLLNSRSDGIYSWRFKHPTVQDAFASLVATSPDLLDIYITGASLDKLMSEVTCGDVDVIGSSIIVPENLYDRVVQKINADQKAGNIPFGRLNRFLSYRVDKNFLIHFLNANPHFINSLSVYSHFTACSDLDVILKLHEHQLLPEEQRKTFVTRIKELAVSTPDAGFLRDDIGQLLTRAEREEILYQIQHALIPQLSSVIETWRWDYNSNEDPESHFEELIGTLGNFKEAFDDKKVQAKLESGLAKIHEIIEELNSDYEEPSNRILYDAEHSRDLGNEFRSIFDDVDI